MVGRDAALATLREVVSRAVDFGAPQLVTIVGNQGTGKTRLITELLAALASDPARPRVWRGRARRDAAGAPTRLAAVTSLLQDRLALTPAPDDASRLRVAHEVRQVTGGDAAELLHYVGGFVGLDFPPTPFLKVLGAQPRQRAELARVALRRFVELDAAVAPLVLAFDDMQWADDEALTLINELAATLAGAPVVILVAARPEMLVRSATWGQGAVDHAQIELRNLEQDVAEQMLRHLLGRCGAVPEDVLGEAVEQTGGNPSFLEQLVRLYLANGTIDATGPVWRLRVEAALATELPVGIEEAIEGRIAALERDERALLEKAAVFGNVFWVSAVVAMTRLEAAGANGDDDLAAPIPLDAEWSEGEPVRRAIGDAIAGLVDRDYVLSLDAEDSSMTGDVEVVFKHNLERELIVRATEPGRLARYHLLAAQWLEARLPGRSDEQLEFLASLYERGGDARRAARCYLQGGDRCRARYAAEEARLLYERGLAMLGEADAPARLDALHNLGDVLEQLGKTAEAMDEFGAMLRLAWRFDNRAKAGAAYIRLARGERRLGRYDVAMQHLRRAQDLFERARDDRGIGATLDEMGRIHWLRGAYGQALDFHRQALTIRRALGDRRSIALSLANIGRVHHDTGNFTAAVTQFREALDLRRDIGDMVGVIQSLGDLAGVHLEDQNLELATALIEEARTTARATGDQVALAEVLSRGGEVRAAGGDLAGAVAELTEAKALAASVGDRVTLAVTHQRLAQVQLQLGQLEAADVEAHAAVAVSEAVGLRVHLGSGYRVKAAVAARLGQAMAAEDDFRRAIEILAAVKNEVELARAYQGLAALKDRQGAEAEAAKLRGRADDIFARLRGAAASE
jgi:tetratricopeptide (TPR) repeat protein